MNVKRMPDKIPVILEPDDPKVLEMEQLYCKDIIAAEGDVFYFPANDWGAFFDHLTAEEYPRPIYVNGTYSEQIKIDAHVIIEQACEDLHEDAEETISKEDIGELQAFLDQWCARQIWTRTYYKDPNCLVRIPWKDYDEEEDV
jgi:hypothetical protein